MKRQISFEEKELNESVSKMLTLIGQIKDDVGYVYEKDGNSFYAKRALSDINILISEINGLKN
jgi:hypothetical protein